MKIQNDIRMADISDKLRTKRVAVAQAKVFMKKDTLSKLIKGTRFPRAMS